MAAVTQPPTRNSPPRKSIREGPLSSDFVDVPAIPLREHQRNHFAYWVLHAWSFVGSVPAAAKHAGTRDHHRRREDPARALRGLDRERDGRDRAAFRPGPARARSRAGDPLHHRRRKAPAPGDQGRVRRARARASMPSHKERNVTDLLLERDRPQILARIRGAWALKDPSPAQERLERLASALDRTGPTPPARCARDCRTR